MSITWEQAAPLQNKPNEAADWELSVMQVSREKVKCGVQYSINQHSLQP